MEIHTGYPTLWHCSVTRESLAVTTLDCLQGPVTKYKRSTTCELYVSAAHVLFPVPTKAERKLINESDRSSSSQWTQWTLLKLASHRIRMYTSTSKQQLHTSQQRKVPTAVAVAVSSSNPL
jgi:hypothetical protein